MLGYLLISFKIPPACIWLRISGLPSSKLYDEQEFPIFGKSNNFMARCGDWCKNIFCTVSGHPHGMIELYFC